MKSNNYDNINFSIDEDAIALYLKLLGNRKDYSIFGGKPEWSEKAKKYMIPKDSQNKKTEWITKEAIPKVLGEYVRKGWTVWISLNDKEIANDTIEGVTGIYCFWFDFDPPRTNKAEPATNEERKKAFEEAKKFKEWMHKTFGVIGFIACSGNGYHVFFPINSFQLVGKTFRKEFNDKQRQFYKKLREASNAPFDTTTDIRRVTQPIGCSNMKIPDKPLRTYWIDKPSDEDIEKARKANFVLLEAVLDTKSEQPKTVIVTGSHPKFEVLLKKDAKVRELYEGNWQKYGFKSERSGAEQSLVTKLCQVGFSDDEIKAIMLGCKIGKWQEKDESYYDITIRKGREFAAEYKKKKDAESEKKVKASIQWKVQHANSDEVTEYILFMQGRQTQGEQIAKETTEKNRQGWGKGDPQFFDPIIKKIETDEQLTREEERGARNKLRRYWRQLRELFNEEELLAEYAQREEEEESKDITKLSVADIKKLEDFKANGEISNYVVYHKLIGSNPNDFHVKVYLNSDEIKEERTLPRSTPQQTAPSVNFYERDYGSLRELFYKLKEIHTDYTAYPPNSEYPILTTLGSISSYFREVFYTYPYFDFTSPEVECGKTTAMKTMTFSSFYGTVTASFSESVMFREIDASHCVYGLDNVERLFTKPKDYVPIIDWLSSSYSRDIPCKRLEKQGDKWIVVYFDGYGIKAFTHVRDFPYQFRALKSRAIAIFMQKGKPKKFYPTPEKFIDIRDRLYHARLREFKKVEETYERLIKSNILIGRLGDLYYPLLTIARLVDGKENGEIFEKVLAFAHKEEQDRVQYDQWNKILVFTLYEEGFLGSVSSQDIKPVYHENLDKEGLVGRDTKVTTQSVTSRLKKLGFPRDTGKTTGNKTWFLIDAKEVDAKCYEYGIKTEPPSNTPPNANFSNFSNSESEEEESKQRRAEEEEEKERSTEKIDFDDFISGKSEKSEKSEQKGGIREITKKKEKQIIILNAHAGKFLILKNPYVNITRVAKFSTKNNARRFPDEHIQN